MIDTNSERFRKAFDAWLKCRGNFRESIAAALTAWEASSPSVWRSTKNDPPGDDDSVIARAWIGGGWSTTGALPGAYVVASPKKYPSWAPYPDIDDGTTPEDWK
jgi:hypothetical protein